MKVVPSPIPRRRFLATGAAALGLAPLAYLRAQQGSPNEEIAMGVIGYSKQALNWDPQAEKVLANPEQAKHPRLSAQIQG